MKTTGTRLTAIVLLTCCTASVSYAAPPKKITVCHIEDVVEIDVNTGDEVIVDTIIETKRLPSRAVIAHLRHGDFLPNSVADEEGVRTKLCVVPDDIGMTLVSFGDSGDEAVRSVKADVAESRNRPVTIADTLHPNIHQNNGPGQNANPNGANDGGGNMHGIANVPGQGGDRPGDDSVPGQANELATVHGGIDAVNRNVD